MRSSGRSSVSLAGITFHFRKEIRKFMPLDYSVFVVQLFIFQSLFSLTILLTTILWLQIMTFNTILNNITVLSACRCTLDITTLQSLMNTPDIEQLRPSLLVSSLSIPQRHVMVWSSRGILTLHLQSWLIELSVVTLSSTTPGSSRWALSGCGIEICVFW